jgi:hypothetical protein
MMFQSYTYKPNPLKVKEDRRDTLFIACGVLLFVMVFIFLFRGILGLLILGSLAYTLVQLKINENKKKGANRFGSLVEPLVLTRELLTVGKKEFRIENLQDFKIEAVDFLDKPADFFGTSAGIDNWINFKLDGTEYSFQFQVRKIADLKILSKIAESIKIS